jgi:hypothetical protein
MYHFGLHWPLICCMYPITKSSIGLHLCLVLFAPTSTNEFVYPNSIWLTLILCCFFVRIKHCVVLLSLLSSKSNICHPFNFNFVTTYPSPPWSSPMPLATPYLLSYDVHWRNPYAFCWFDSFYLQVLTSYSFFDLLIII